MTTRTWIGGGNNQASNAALWSPHGAPKPGDTLYTHGGTMNVTGNALAGDSLFFLGGVGSGIETINVSGHAAFTTGCGPRIDAHITVNVGKGSVWTGSIKGQGQITVKGAGTFDNQASSVTVCQDTIAANVGGTGTFTLSGGQLTFMAGVAATQTVTVDGNAITLASKLTVDAPSAFHAHVKVGLGDVLLAGLHADSYSFNGSTLSLSHNGSVIDTMSLGLLPDLPTLSVQQTAAGVYVGQAVGGTPIPDPPAHGWGHIVAAYL